jgi:hypothetical protein
MKTNGTYGVALIVGTLGAVVTMAFHPTGFDPHASAEAVAHEMSILVAVHTLALLSIPILVFGFVGVTMRAGWRRPEALLAFIIYGLSAVAIMFAGIIGWFVSAAALFGLLSGHVHMSAHGFGLIVLLQGMWVIALGLSMLRADRNDVLAPPDAVRA